MKFNLIVLGVLLSLILSACLGGAPQQRFLHITDTGHCEEKPDNANTVDGLIIAIKDFKSLSSLDRTNVLISSGRVLAPSHSWYWEATPAETLTMTVADRISYSGGFSSAWPYRPRIERNAMLSGYVTAFATELSNPARFTVSVRIELWNNRGNEKLAVKDFQVTRELPDSFGPEKLGLPNDLAETAASAVCILGNEVRAWLEDNENLIQNH